MGCYFNIPIFVEYALSSNMWRVLEMIPWAAEKNICSWYVDRMF